MSWKAGKIADLAASMNISIEIRNELPGRFLKGFLSTQKSAKIKWKRLFRLCPKGGYLY
jgi:hypothetical protein